jgi:hypothetical protein
VQNQRQSCGRYADPKEKDKNLATRALKLGRLDRKLAATKAFHHVILAKEMLALAGQGRSTA